MTLPSMALRLFRLNMDDNFVISVPWNDEVKKFTRRAYTGGRVECYKSGKHENVNIFDVNSMYPAVMRANVFPSSARAAWTETYRTDLLGFWDIEYEQTNVSIPAVLRDESSGKFTYKGAGVYTTSEIELLKEQGANITVKSGLVFQRATKIFEKFVDKYYSLRLQAQREGNSALAFVCKILLNSLYGKFGQIGVKQQIVQVSKEKIAEVIDNGGAVHIISDDYMVTLENDMVEHEFVAVAAYVTSYARIVLYRHILSCGDNYLYSDTDSVHCTDVSLPTGDTLGEMKLEYTGEVIYLAKKLYHPKDGQPKAKGIGRAIKNGAITYDTFTVLLDKEKDMEVTFDVFPTVKEVLSGKQRACVMFQRKRRIKRLE
jgi:DNA polymerase elongation subunit (family B)